MELVKLIFFFVFVYGMANIIVYGSIFEKFREFWKNVSPNFFGVLFSCMMCTPFWCGVIISYFFYSPSLDLNILKDIDLYFFTISKEYSSLFVDACVGSGSAWLLHTWQESMESGN